MTKYDYLKRCVLARTPLEQKAWYTYMLAFPDVATHPWQDLEPLSAYPQADGMYFVDQVGDTAQKVLVKLSDVSTKAPVFHIQDSIDVDAGWLPSITSKLTTKLGNLVINTVALYPSLQTKLPYQDGPISVKGLEAQLAKRLVNEEEAKEDDITVPQYLDCLDRLWFFTQLAPLVNIAATAKLITRAPGTKELRKKLLEENTGKLSDPAVVADIVSQLDKHDKAYLAGDPVFAKGLSKKENTARKKLHQMYGETNDFDAGIGSDPILSSMDEGLDISPKNLTKYINDLRYASYSRGHSTQLAGYTYKVLQRSISGVDIVDTDCGTQRGYTRLITERNSSKLLSRFVKLSATDKDWTLVESPDQAKSYLGKVLITRSALYCQSAGNTLCYRCLGETFKGSAAAMTNLAASMSSEFMTLFLKRMHTSGFTLTTLEKKDLFT